MTFFEVRDAGKRFGKIAAVDGVSFTLERGEMVALIGPNGAGKSTLLNLLTGVHRLDRGTIVFEGASIGKLRPDERFRLGLSRTFQNTRLLADLSVEENVALPFYARHTHHESHQLARGLLGEFGLTGYAHEPPAVLNTVARKLVELVRAFAGEPRMVLLDEVFAGMSADEIARYVGQLIAMQAASGATVVLVEHLLPVVRKVATRVLVLVNGRLIADGPIDATLADATVVEAYLGRGREVGAEPS